MLATRALRSVGACGRRRGRSERAGRRGARVVTITGHGSGGSAKTRVAGGPRAREGEGEPPNSSSSRTATTTRRCWDATGARARPRRRGTAGATPSRASVARRRSRGRVSSSTGRRTRNARRHDARTLEAIERRWRSVRGPSRERDALGPASRPRARADAGGGEWSVNGLRERIRAGFSERRRPRGDRRAIFVRRARGLLPMALEARRRRASPSWAGETRFAPPIAS